MPNHPCNARSNYCIKLCTIVKVICGSIYSTQYASLIYSALYQLLFWMFCYDFFPLVCSAAAFSQAGDYILIAQGIYCIVCHCCYEELMLLPCDLMYIRTSVGLFTDLNFSDSLDVVFKPFFCTIRYGEFTGDPPSIRYWKSSNSKR